MSHVTASTWEVHPSPTYGPLHVHPGPRLLDGICHGPSLAVHRATWGRSPTSVSTTCWPC